ncbi:hypothetical protein Q2T46_10630 [Thermoanaerobacterium sp. CMT5567-10]|uniref:hypothetical protein n=1 Tax=Thermoanaerobacterium sp. CMT5567-10 TaxID=3061989 RepID=UPI0026DF63FF|nr:hypothetical protein [Thermoanaerobacterium sp. CMT5567-10]WKV07998.1 hypothetical protein Q2T46_10630 [Thermoanaerobacterium sp. CMT5567-10]
MIGIIFIGDLKYCPYLNKYTQVLDEENQKYEVLFWNREGKSVDYPLNYFSLNLKSVLNRHPLFKILDFLKFRKWVKNQIKTRNYDKLIILSTLSGVLIAKTLINKYKYNYIFDIRDYSYENNKMFFNIEENLIRNSFFTCISSEGFKEFLPKGYPYIIAHNINKNDYQNKKKFIKKDKGSILNVVFIGAVRYFKHQVKIIDRLKNDNRFNLIYHGSGAELDLFINYCKKNNISNLKFTGEYNNSDKNKLLIKADILNNSYKASKMMETKYAISNKYYDGIIYGIPQLVETNTYKQSKVEELGIGIGLDVEEEDFADKLYEYYYNIDEKKFNDSCNKELQKILIEDQLYLEKIREFINS